MPGGCLINRLAARLRLLADEVAATPTLTQAPLLRQIAADIEKTLMPTTLNTRPLNSSAVLQFLLWNGTGRYTRAVPNIRWAGVVSRIEFVVANYVGPNPVFAAPSYDLLCDGVVLATATVLPTSGKGRFSNVNFAAISDGWHEFDIRPTVPTLETAHPIHAYVGAVVPQTLAPVTTGSFGIVNDTNYVAMWGMVPATIDPPVFTRADRVAVPFDTPLPPQSLFRRELLPCINGDPTYLYRTRDGLPTCNGDHGYAFTIVTGKLPGVVTRDGPYGVGLTPGVTHAQLGRNGQIHFTDSWRLAKLTPAGEVRTLAGWRNSPTGLELVGDWSAIPEARRGFHELWGMAWDLRTLPIDPASTPIPNGGTLERTHLTNPVVFLADSQKSRVCRVEFDKESHATPARVSEFITGLADPWDVVFHDGLLYVSERLKHRVSVWDATTGAFVRTVIEGAALAGLDKSRHPVRYASLDVIRAQPIVAPEGLFIQDGVLYVASISMGQVKKVDLSTGVISTACAWTPVSKSLYAKIAVGDGTFGPRGTVFVSSWEKMRKGAPWAFLPNGSEWQYILTGSSVTPAGLQTLPLADDGYSMAVAQGQGRLVYFSADYTAIELTQAQPGDVAIDKAAYQRGMQEYDAAGHRLKHGIHGFAQWNAKYLPSAMSDDMRYYLRQHGHPV